MEKKRRGSWGEGGEGKRGPIGDEVVWNRSLSPGKRGDQKRRTNEVKKKHIPWRFRWPRMP
jgi:hypothetical protein